MLNLPNYAALDRLLSRKDSVVQLITSTPYAHWPSIIDVFVDGMKQLHPSGLPITVCVLVDLRRQVVRVATERFGLPHGDPFDVGHVGDCSTLEDVCARYSSACILRSLANAAGTDLDLVDRSCLLVRSNLSHRLTAREIAVSLDCYPLRLTAAVRALLHCTVKAYVRQQRLEAALVLIRAGDKIESVIISVGYRNRTSFFKEFRTRFGMLPSEARDTRLPSARRA